MAVVDQLVALLSYKVEGEADLRRFRGASTRLEKNARASGRAVGMAPSPRPSPVRRCHRHRCSRQGAVVDVNAEFETFEATLDDARRLVAKSARVDDWIRKFAQQTPYEVAGITAAFVKLKVSRHRPDRRDRSRSSAIPRPRWGKTLDQAVEAFADASTGQYERLERIRRSRRSCRRSGHALMGEERRDAVEDHEKEPDRGHQLSEGAFRRELRRRDGKAHEHVDRA